MSNKSKGISGRGLGVGYVTLIMLFAVICLTVLSVLSYQAARANEKLNEKSSVFCTEYYAADGRAKMILSELDNDALEAHSSGFFAESFAELCNEYENISVRQVLEGFSVSFSEPLNERLKLSVNVVFYNTPVESRYSINEWKTISADTEASDAPLGVWDGSPLG